MCEGTVEPPLGPHQRQEMRQRVLKDEARPPPQAQNKNVLLSAEGVDRDTARVAFFAELRSVLEPSVAAEQYNL
jgi:hypothetical protein